MERMRPGEKDVQTGRLPFILGKCLLASYLLTGGALLLLALLLYRFQLSEQIVSIGILAIYTMATFLAGFLTGKGVRGSAVFLGTRGRNALFRPAGGVDFYGQSWL